MAENKLYYGDNLEILQDYIDDESVDLVYLDPPFQSGRDYNVLFKEESGDRSAAQIKAFEDTWHWDIASRAAWEEVVEGGGDVSRAMQAFMTFLGGSDMLAYLSMMAPRLIELRRVLKPTGSIYLHCDPTAGHYLKMLMDAVFGAAGFRNEIVWCYWGPGSPHQRQFMRKHDTIFWYSRGDEWVFNADAVRVPHASKTKANYKPGLKGSGFSGAERAIHKKGKVPEDWWEIAIAPRSTKEYLGYPTQKPERLLERIILASSNEGDMVLDPFCGCGTSIAVAQRLNRRWTGIDITHLAITLIKHRLQDSYGSSVQYDVIGEPVSLAGAKQLATEDPFQFQWWALGLVGARPQEQKKGADKGIDGRLYFHDEPGGPTKQIIFSVKSGKTEAKDVRDLRGVVEREDAALGVEISLQEPTKPMRKEAASAGFYESPWRKTKHPKIQLLTIEELLDGKRIDYPAMTGSNVTYKKAQKHQTKVAEQLHLGHGTEEESPGEAKTGIRSRPSDRGE